MSIKSGVTVSGLEINPVNALPMFLHHLQLAVSFLEATALSERQVCEQINGQDWTGISPKFRKFADTVAHGCFHEFEWDEEKPDENTLTDAKPDLGFQFMVIDANDPDGVKKLHDMIAEALGEDILPRK